MSRIAVFFEFPTLSGGERSMLAVMERLTTESFAAIAPPEGPLADALDACGIPRIPLRIREAGRKVSRDELLGRLKRALDAATPDLLHANSLSLARVLGGFTDEFEIPLTGHVRDIAGLSVAAVADLNRLNGLVAVSHATRDFHVAQGLDAARVCAIHNGIDVARFAPRPRTGSLARELGISPEARIVASIGQICLRKGFDLLPRVAERLSCRERNLHFCLVGERFSEKAESIEFDAAIDREFHRLGLGDHLHRLGYRADVAELLPEIDVLLHPARQEPLGRVLLEAAASGCPIVSTHIGGTTEIVCDGESAQLFAPDDAERAAELIRDVFEHPERTRRLADRARQTIVERFSIERAAQELGVFWKEFVPR